MAPPSQRRRKNHKTSGIVRTFVVGTLAYVFLVGSLRVSGKRTLAKLNAFDLVVTVAYGSTLATVLLSEKVALAEGVAALLLLIALQYLVTALSVRSRAFARAVRSEPSLLLRNGEPVGYLTSGGYGYTIGKSVGYGYVRNADGVSDEFLASGDYELVVANERVPANLGMEAFFDPSNARVKA